MNPRVLAALAALVVAGCGGGGDDDGAEDETLYRLGPTRACLQRADLRVTTRGLDFVASTALGGSVRTKLRGNQVTLAFGRTTDDAIAIERAYRRFAGKGVPLNRVLARDRNVVLLWAEPPTAGHDRRVRDCLEE